MNEEEIMTVRRLLVERGASEYTIDRCLEIIDYYSSYHEVEDGMVIYVLTRIVETAVKYAELNGKKCLSVIIRKIMKMRESWFEQLSDESITVDELADSLKRTLKRMKEEEESESAHANKRKWERHWSRY